MDDVLKDLSVTLLIGGFVILGLEAILYFLYRRSLTGFFQGRVGFQTRSITAVFVAARFGLGLHAQDV
jgi:hypothetical protein